MGTENLEVYTMDNMEEIFEILDECKGVEQPIEWHPEGDVHIHSLQVFHHAIRETGDLDLILAALLHDVGKAENSLGHEQVAMSLLKDLCSPKTLWLIEEHMRIWYYLEGIMRKRMKCEKLITHPWLMELIQLARWDKMGRRQHFKPKYTNEDILDILNRKVIEHFEMREGE